MSESIKHAPVAGVSAGIGGAVVRHLCELGWGVVAVARREECFAALAAETGYEYVATDLGDETAAGALAARIFEGGSVDALANSAGGTLRADTIAYADPDRWIVMYYCNVMTALYAIRTFLPGIYEGGGDLAFPTSTTAHDTYSGGGGYVAAGRVERIIVDILCQELIGEPVRITEIVSGMVKIPEFLLNRLGSEEIAAEAYEDVAESLPVDDVTDAIYWALARPAHVNTGSVILRPVVQATSILLAR